MRPLRTQSGATRRALWLIAVLATVCVVVAVALTETASGGTSRTTALGRPRTGAPAARVVQSRTTLPPSPQPPSSPPSTPGLSSALPRASNGASLECQAVTGLATESPAQLVSQLLFVGVGDQGQLHQALDEARPAGGVFLVGSSGGWFANGALRDAARLSPVPPIVAADEEGGRVTRIAYEYGPMPSAHSMSALGPSTIESIARQRGADLLALGINMDLAPDADLYDPANAVINDRAFASDPAVVVADDAAFERGLLESHVVPVLKHFPGHGHSTGDSHLQVTSTPQWSLMLGADAIPFVRLAASAMVVMVGHLRVPGLTEPGTPASLSPSALGFLRGPAGFQGLAVTDDLAMSAVTLIDSVPDAAVRAVVAGEDMVGVTPTYPGEIADITAALSRAVASGRIPMSRLTAALRHIESLKRYIYCT